MITPESPYQSYVYAYPHKTAYRPIEPALPLADLWEREDKSALFLYVHIPFCEMRCGFCNLFTTVNPSQSLESLYLDTLERQARMVKDALGESHFARVAIGGGTPTYLSAAELTRVFDIAQNIMGIDLARTPMSVETSPLTATPERLAVLRERSTSRVSIGVQSFIDAEVHAAGRAQKVVDVHRALANIRDANIPTLNIDLIYGLPGQTLESWMQSLNSALEYQPEELYLYPLYVRPLTGITKIDQAWSDIRLECYRAAREHLLARGYTQISMRMFKAAHAPQDNGTIYCCQEDGMVGLGCGARSYTRDYHYATDYAVGRQGILDILHHYVQQPTEIFGKAVYGFHLNDDDQRRRYILKSLLHATGLNLADYRAYFGTDALADHPVLLTLESQGWITQASGIFRLTTAGLEYSDALGEVFYSPHVSALMREFELR